MTVARVAAGIQAVVALGVAAFCTYLVLVNLHETLHPRPDSFDGLASAIAVRIGLPAVAITLAAGVPALLLRRSNRAAAIVLICGEGLIATGLAGTAPETFHSLPYDAVPTTIWLAVAGSTAAAVIGVTTASARRWLFDCVGGAR